MSGGRCIRTGVLAGLIVIGLGGCSAWPPLFPGSRDEGGGEDTANTPRHRPAVIDTRRPAAPAVTAQRQPEAVPDLWRRIGEELRMAPRAERRDADPLTRFGNSARRLNESAARARPFLGHIVNEIERRGLPYEIALIPIIESAYNPAATSPAGAAGLWQLMPDTARRFGVAQSRWYDGRRDVVESTRAALDYFELLRDRFMGDWKLVFAAYNCGERTVERAMERNARRGMATDFHALKLPRSTREYVPRLLALTEIIAHPEAHGVELPRIPGGPHFDIVEVGPALDLNRVIDWVTLDEAEFDTLNAAFRKRYTVAGAPSRVLVPAGEGDSVREALAALPREARTPAAEHVVAAGETLSHIALSSGISVAALKQVNGLTSNRLAVGQTLRVPPPTALPEPLPSASDTAAAAPPPERTHVVAPGDNLWDLARRYDTSVDALARANGIDRRATLRLGQRLRVPSASAPATPAAVAAYEVRHGDSLWTISRRFKVSVADLQRWNRLGSDHRLQPGQRLLVARPSAQDAHHDI